MVQVPNSSMDPMPKISVRCRWSVWWSVSSLLESDSSSFFGYYGYHWVAASHDFTVSSHTATGRDSILSWKFWSWWMTIKQLPGWSTYHTPKQTQSANRPKTCHNISQYVTIFHNMSQLICRNSWREVETATWMITDKMAIWACKLKPCAHHEPPATSIVNEANEHTLSWAYSFRISLSITVTHDLNKKRTHNYIYNYILYIYVQMYTHTPTHTYYIYIYTNQARHINHTKPYIKLMTHKLSCGWESLSSSQRPTMAHPSSPRILSKTSDVFQIEAPVENIMLRRYARNIDKEW